MSKKTPTEPEPVDKAHAMLRDIVRWLGPAWRPCPICSRHHPPAVASGTGDKT